MVRVDIRASTSLATFVYWFGTKARLTRMAWFEVAS